MTVVAAEIGRHLKVARKVLEVWQQDGLPGPTIDDDLRKVAAEVELLETMAEAHPGRAKALRRLADKYREFERRLAA